jgi:hypothetical protein
MAGDAPNIVNDVAGAAALPFVMTNKVKQVAVTNTHATQTLTVAVSSSSVSAAAAKAAAGVGSGIAVIGADDVYTIPALQRKVVWKSSAPRFVALSLIASGASSGFTAEGTTWRD